MMSFFNQRHFYTIKENFTTYRKIDGKLVNASNFQPSVSAMKFTTQVEL